MNQHFNTRIRSARTGLVAMAAFPLFLAPLAAIPAFSGEITSLAAGGKPVPGEFAGLRERWAQHMDAFGVSGFAVAVVKGDDVIYLDTFGFRDAERGLPVTPDTIYYIASCTKTYTAAGIMALVDDGRLQLDDPVRKHLPRLELPDAALTEKLTVRDLLCHRYGINSGPIVLLDAYTGEINDDRYFEHLKQARIAGDTQYTNVHFTLAGRVIQAVSGQEWRAFLRDRIFTPAGMIRTTGFADTMYADADAATPLLHDGDGWSPASVRKTDRTMHAAGGLGSSIADMAGWLRIQLNHGRANGKQILSESAVREMHAQQSESEPEGRIRRWVGYGLGWRVGTYRGRPFRGHGGGYQGAAAELYFLPEERIGVAVATNGSGPPSGFIDAIVTIDVLDRLLGIQEEDLLPAYREEAATWMERRRAEAARATSAQLRPGNGLTLPLEAYLGAYASASWGTLYISAERGGLSFRLGNMPIEFAPAGENRFKEADDDDWSGRFIVDGGRVVGVALEGPFGSLSFAK